MIDKNTYIANSQVHTFCVPTFSLIYKSYPLPPKILLWENTINVIQ